MQARRRRGDSAGDGAGASASAQPGGTAAAGSEGDGGGAPSTGAADGPEEVRAAARRTAKESFDTTRAAQQGL
eukprot:5974696-Pyramimonas_sp.AAC.1